MYLGNVICLERADSYLISFCDIITQPLRLEIRSVDHHWRICTTYDAECLGGHDYVGQDTLGWEQSTDHTGIMLDWLDIA